MKWHENGVKLERYTRDIMMRSHLGFKEEYRFKGAFSGRLCKADFFLTRTTPPIMLECRHVERGNHRRGRWEVHGSAAYTATIANIYKHKLGEYSNYDLVFILGGDQHEVLAADIELWGLGGYLSVHVDELSDYLSGLEQTEFDPDFRFLNGRSKHRQRSLWER